MFIKRMVIIQPANKNLIASNSNGSPLDLSAIKDIIRGNATQPSNGNIDYVFVSPTSVIANGAAAETVVTDGVTYNSNIGSKGIDIVFKPERKRGDRCQVSVDDSVSKQDTYLNKPRADRNYGTCTDIRLGPNRVDAGTAKRALIKFEIPETIGKEKWENTNIIDSAVFFYGSNTVSSASPNYRFYEILPPNADWKEGTRCDAGVSDDSPSWRRKSEQPIVGWAGRLACSESGVDYVSTHLFSATVTSDADAWIEFSQNSTFLNEFLNRMLVSPDSNPGFVGELFSEVPITSFIVFSGNYTTDITLRPKMLFLYEQEVSGLDGGVESLRTSMRISDDEIGDDFIRDLIGGQ